MSGPIDSNDFYTAVGPGSKFSALFDPLICSEHDLANHFYDGMVAANGGGQQGQACATYVGFALWTRYLPLLSTTPDTPSSLADESKVPQLFATAVALRNLTGKFGKLLRSGKPVHASFQVAIF